MVKEDGTSKLVDLLESIGETEVGGFKYLRMIRSARNFDQEWRSRNGKRVWFAYDFRDILDRLLSELRKS